LLGALAWGTPIGVLGQVVVEGSVVDGSTKEPLPGASVQIKGTYSGSITNGNGLFTLKTGSLPVTLIVRFIGYQSAELEIQSAAQIPISIALAPSTLKLPELTITGEDPAIRIMRRVIEEKQKWRKELHTYSVLAYNRFRMENDSGIVSIWESGTKAFWDEKRGIREVSLWQQKTQNMEIDDLLPAAMFVVNLYDDDIEVAGHTLMGVTHPKALSFYDFSLTSISARDNSEVYIISAKPKLKTSAGFVGQIAVLDEKYALISAELKPGAAFLFPPPVNGVDIQYEQQFSSFGGDFWLPVDFKADMDVQIGFGGLLEFPKFKIRQLSSLTDFEVNVVLPDSLYAQRSVVVRDTVLSKVTVRPPDAVQIPLTPEEAIAYAEIDSTMTLEKAYEPTGILARFVKTSIDDNNNGNRNRNRGGRGTGRGNASDFSLQSSHRPAFWINRVEGYHFRLNTDLEPNRVWTISNTLGYSSAQKKVGWEVGVERQAKVTLGVKYTDLIKSQLEPSLRSQLFTSGPLVVGEPDYYDYYSNKGFAVSVTKQWMRRNRLVSSITYASESHNPLVQKQFSSFVGMDFEVRPNQSISKGSLQYVKLELKGERDSLPIPIGPQRQWKVNFEQSLAGSITDSGQYSRLEAEVQWRFDTFFSRRLLPNSLDVRLVGGRIWGDHIPNQKLGYIDGLTFFSFFGGIKTLATRPYVGDTWGLLAWEHTFRTVPFEVIGFDWAVQKHLNVLVHGAHGKATNQSSTASVNNSENVHHEMGVSLSGLFSLFRLDATWRLDQPDFRWGISVARIF